MSLQTIRIKKIARLSFVLPLCFSFPNLKVLSIIESQIEDFSSLMMEFSKCSYLTELGISGAPDFHDEHALTR